MNSGAESVDSFTPANRVAVQRRRPRPESFAPASLPTTPTTTLGGSSLIAVFIAWSANTPRPAPSRSLFRKMAAETPAELAAWILRGTLGRGHLSHAAEILGRETAETNSADGVVLVLDRLLAHASPAVREGAVYGLGHHLTPRVRRRLQQLAVIDPSAGVRQAIEDVLEG